MPLVEDDKAEWRFWKELEFRVSREMQTKSFRKRLRPWLWCDGFNPEHYLLNQVPSRITGGVWIGIVKSSDQEEWKFSLILPFAASSRADITWSALPLPSETDDWLVIDQEKKEIEVRLSSN
jgi:hypothetical protein